MVFICTHTHTHTHTHTGILLSHKKEYNNAVCSYMDMPRNYYTKWTKSEREREIPYDITCIWTLKYDTNRLIYKTETDSDIENRPVVAKGEGGGGRVDWEFGISRSKLLYG